MAAGFIITLWMRSLLRELLQGVINLVLVISPIRRHGLVSSLLAWVMMEGRVIPDPLAEGEVEMAIIMGNRRIMLKSHPRIPNDP